MNLKNSAFTLMGLMVVASLLFPTSVLAQTGDLFSGQDHSYTVIFRGNGEAIVYGKIIFTNTGDDPTQTFSIEIPSVKVEELKILQSFTPEYNPSNCQGFPSLAPGTTCSLQKNPFSQASAPYIQPQTYYQKLDYSKTGALYELNLQQPIQPAQQGTLILAYVASGYVSKNLGVYNFHFETPKVNSRIKTVTVSVDVDSDLVLQGKRAEVNYATEQLSTDFDSATAGLNRSGLSLPESPQMTKTIEQIGEGGPLFRSAQNLAPNESFRVSGKYATNNWALSWLGLVWKGLLILAVLLSVVFFVKKWQKKHNNSVTASVVSGGAAIAKEEVFHLFHHLYTSIGLGVNIVNFGVIYGISVASSLLSDNYNYENSVILVGILLFLIGSLTVLTAYVLPPILIGIRFGWRAGVSVIVNSLLWTVVLTTLYLILNLNHII